MVDLMADFRSMGQQHHMSAIFRSMILSMRNAGGDGRANARVDYFIMGTLP